MTLFSRNAEMTHIKTRVGQKIRNFRSSISVAVANAIDNLYRDDLRGVTDQRRTTEGEAAQGDAGKAAAKKLLGKSLRASAGIRPVPYRLKAHCCIAEGPRFRAKGDDEFGNPLFLQLLRLSFFDMLC